MKKLIFFIGLFTIQQVVIHAQTLPQTIGDIINLDNNNSETQQEYIARDKIIFHPGYQFHAATDNTMIARIDESLVLPVDYTPQNQVINVDDYHIDQSLPVGAIAGAPAVSATGAATYSIPIYTPKGTAGMEPKISLVYSSQSGNGIAGYGWNIAGISAISRTGKNIYYDNKIQGIQLDDNDNFSLDGKRLIFLNGFGSIYNYTFEIEDFSRIEYNSSDLTFKLKLKNGTVIEYGNTTDSKLIPEGTTVPYAWYINKITDRNNNYIEYKYNNEGGEVVISEINYTGNTDAGISPYNSIKFYYSERSDKNKLFIVGSELKNEKLLRMIKVFSDNQHIRTYKLKYYFNLYSKLNEIQETSLGGEKINSTIIQYGKDGILFSDNATNFNQGSPFTFLQGDFNGDGKTDIVASISSDFFGLKRFTNFTINDISAQLFLGDFTNFCYITDSRQSKLGNAPGSYFSDFNGDNIEDILLLDLPNTPSFEFCSTNNCSGSNNENIYFIELNNIKILTGNQDNSGFDIQDHQVNDTYRYFNPENNFLFIGDFNGDGYSDYLSILSNGFGLGSHTWSYLINNMNNADNYQIYYVLPKTNETFTINTNYLNLFDFLNAEQNYIVDFDGDGKQDIMLVNDNGFKVYSFEKVGSEYYIVLTYSNTDITSENNFMFGDFNGDGKTDIFTYKVSVSNSEFHIYFSTGNNIYEKDFIPDNFLYNNYHFLIGDFNGDGKSDILNGYNNNNNNCCFDIYYSNGKNFIKTVYSKPNYNLSDNFVLGDFDGNGSNDVLNVTTDPSQREIFYFNKISGEDPGADNANAGLVRSLFVTKISDGFNNWINFGYRPATESAGVYNKNSLYSSIAPSYFTSNFEVPLMVVSELRSYNGTLNGSGYNFIDYNYFTALYNKQKKGFLGFLKIEKTTTNAYATSHKKYSDWNEYNSVHEILLPSISNFFDLENGESLKTRNINTYDYVDLGNKRFQIKTTKTELINYLKANKIVIDYTINNDGNITDKVISYKNLNNNAVEKTETYHFEYDNAGLNLPYKISYFSKSIVVGSELPYTVAVSNTYNNTNGNIETQEKLGITTHYENYDDFGNAWTIRKSTPNMNDRNETFTYTDNGCFISSRTNQLNHTILYEYNTLFGKIKKITDINNLETKYFYDNWGRLNKIIYPTGIVIKNSIDWVQPQILEIPNALFFSLSTQTDMPYRKKYYDSFGRVVRTETESYGKTLLADKEYDEMGRVVNFSDPTFESDYSQANWTNNLYDNYSRIIKTTYQGIEINYNYDISSGQYTENTNYNVSGSGTRNYTTVFDVTGNVTESHYPMGSSVSFVYGSHGQPVNITADGINTTMNYNATTGYQELLTDVDAGTTQYGSYTGFGELKQQTDARGNTYTNTYDAYGRITDMDGPGGNIHTAFVPSGNGIEQVKDITAQNGTGKHFVYDEFGRVTSKKETIDNIDYTSSYEYDQYGKITKKIYPGGFALQYIYNNQGELLGVKQDGNNNYIWYCNQYTAYGQPVTVFLGNNGSNLKTEYIYDNNNRLSDITTGNNFDMHYDWDNTTGNLTSRTDNAKGLTGTFTYDNLDRLTSWQVQGEPIYETHYATNGNITSKSDIATGNLEYDPVKLHAVIKVNTPLTAISFNTQNITYTGFNKVETISEEDLANNVRHELHFTYGPDRYRRKTVMKDIDMLTGNETVIYTRYYDGNYEKEVTAAGTKEFYYISGPTGIIAVYVVTNGVGQLYYTLTDHLGSIVALMDESGNIVEETNYDPWGRVRNPNDWTYANAQPLSLIFRGFTGHEMLPEFGLINMNGRLYDPALGRFLSPDNFVQDPANAQNYNRYAYCLNNPLKYTDPDGEWFGVDDAIVAGVGFLIGYISYGIYTGDWGWDAVASGGIAAVSSWLIYNTAGAATGILTNLGFSNGAAIVIGNGIGGAIGSFTGSIASQAYFTGSVDFNKAVNSALYGFGFGVGSSIVDLSLMDERFFMHHTIKYIMRSTVGEFAGNILSGRGFDEMTYGFNPGIILPFTTDIISISSTYWASKIAQKKYNELLKEAKEKRVNIESDIELKAKLDYGYYTEDSGEWIAGSNNGDYIYNEVGVTARVEIIKGGFEINKIGNSTPHGASFPNLSGIRMDIPIYKLPFNHTSAISFANSYALSYRLWFY